MSYQTIKVLVPSERTAKTLLPHAFSVAKPFQAHLTGLHVIRGVRYYGSADVYLPETVYQMQRDAFKEQAKLAKAAFQAEAEKHDTLTDFQCDGEFHQDELDQIYAAARVSDLFVVAHEEQDDLTMDWDASSAIALNSGRPVLAVPSTYTGDTIGSNVVIAWNGAREAARATYDAMPFIKNAKNVTLLTIDPDSHSVSEGFSPGDEIARVLARHGVEANVVAVPSRSGGPGAELRAQLEALGCDLLVMGCYGHSRLREFVFGGVTRSVLAEMKVPTLLSH